MADNQRLDRATLEGMGISAENIDTIMRLNGNTINAERQGRQQLEADLETARDELARRADYDDVVTERDTLRQNATATETEIGELRAFKKTTEYRAKFTAAQGARKFVNSVTEKQAFSDFVTASKNPENEGKSDEDIFASVVADDYFSGKHSVVMPPHTGKPNADDNKAYQDKMYANNPFYRG